MIVKEVPQLGDDPPVKFPPAVLVMQVVVPRVVEPETVLVVPVVLIQGEPVLERNNAVGGAVDD